MIISNFADLGKYFTNSFVKNSSYVREIALIKKKPEHIGILKKTWYKFIFEKWKSNEQINIMTHEYIETWDHIENSSAYT